MLRRLGGSEDDMLAVQSNLASSYAKLGQTDEAMRIERDVYSGRLRQHGEEHEVTLVAANNYAAALLGAKRYTVAKRLLHKTIPVARRVLRDNHDIVLRMSTTYATALHLDPSATLLDLREAVTTLEEAGRTARRVFGGSNPLTTGIEFALRVSRKSLASHPEAS